MAIGTQIKLLNEIADRETFDLDLIDDICSAVESSKQGKQAIPAMFRVLETFPEENFGSPGEIVHVLEKFFRHGYEQRLLESVLRCPTEQTIWMLNRVVNGLKGAEQKVFTDALTSVARNQALAPQLRTLAEDFLAN